MGAMSIQTALILVALASSLVLVMQKSERLFPMIALVAAGMEALLAFGLVSLSVASFRIDVILPALLVIAGIVCWSRSTAKGTTTASTLISLIGLMQLLTSLRFL